MGCVSLHKKGFDTDPPIAVTLSTPRRMPATESYRWNTGAVVIVIVNDMVGCATIGRTPTMARTTSMARTTRLTWMAGMGRTSTDFLNCQSRFAIFFLLDISRTDISDCRAHGGVKTEHLTGRSTHADFARCAPCSTVRILALGLQSPSVAWQASTARGPPARLHLPFFECERLWERSTLSFPRRLNDCPRYPRIVCQSNKLEQRVRSRQAGEGVFAEGRSVPVTRKEFECAGELNEEEPSLRL